MESQKGNEPRIILHVDLNSFFATAEQQANPALRGKPVGVVKGKGRSCIIAASVEAKKKGVGTGWRVYDAKKLCPEIILVPADFDKYLDISRRFIKICSSYSPTCEVFSLDECFIDVTETEKFFLNAFNIVFEIKRRLKEEVGEYMTCSAGVSYNRFLAKLASDQIKPDGLFWITEDNVLKVLDKSRLTDVCGLGWGLNTHLTTLGIDNFAQIRALPFEFLHKHFGPYWSEHLYDISRGIDVSLVNSFTALGQQKSVGRTYTTHRKLTTRSEVYKVARNLCEEAAYKARSMNLTGRYVGFTLRTGGKSWSKNNDPDIKAWYGHRTLKNYIHRGSDLFALCRQISANWGFGDIIFCGVTLGMLTTLETQPIPLFEKERKLDKLVNSVDTVNNKYGDYTVFPAQLLGMPIVMPEVTGFFGDRKYQLGKMATLT